MELLAAPFFCPKFTMFWMNRRMWHTTSKQQCEIVGIKKPQKIGVE